MNYHLKRLSELLAAMTELLSGNPQRRETLGEEKQLTFEPKEQNRRVYSDIRKRVRKSRTEVENRRER
jgi:hypothetical protein